jgi:hypothetical protein
VRRRKGAQEQRIHRALSVLDPVVGHLAGYSYPRALTSGVYPGEYVSPANVR